MLRFNPKPLNKLNFTVSITDILITQYFNILLFIERTDY